MFFSTANSPARVEVVLVDEPEFEPRVFPGEDSHAVETRLRNNSTTTCKL